MAEERLIERQKLALGASRVYIVGLGMWFSSVLTMFIAAAIFFWVKVFGNIHITGREHVNTLASSENVLIVANHQSMIDAFLIGAAAFWPKALWHPARYFPWQTVDAKNFLWLFPWFRIGPFVCIKRNKKGERRDASAYIKLCRVLPHAIVQIFPEGTRSTNAKDKLCHTQSGIFIGKPHYGVGALLLQTKPTILPVLVKGMDRVLPVGSRWPKLKEASVEIIFGPPLKSEELIATLPKGLNIRQKRQELIDSAMHYVASLDSDTSRN